MNYETTLLSDMPATVSLPSEPSHLTVASTPRATCLAALSATAAYVWRSDDASLQRVVQNVAATPLQVRALAFSSDGDLMLAAEAGGEGGTPPQDRGAQGRAGLDVVG